MRNLIGLPMFLAGGWLLWAALARRRRVLAAAREAAARGDAPARLNPSLAIMADIMPPLILFGLAVAAGQVVLAFVMTGGLSGQGTFSALDLAGFLFLLAAYGVWIVLRTRHRPGGAER